MSENENNNTNNFDELKKIISENLVKLRKQANLTQQELAEKINYSDKAVSKWERADGVPDVLVLKTLADIYGVTVNDFLIRHEDAPVKPRTKNIAARRWLISLLSAGLVWFVATVITVLWLLIDSSATAEVARYAYIAAIPASAIVLLVFSCIWGKLWQRFALVSALIWSLCLLVHIVLLKAAPQVHSWLIYLIGAGLQLLVILWFLLQFFVMRDKAKREKVFENN